MPSIVAANSFRRPGLQQVSRLPRIYINGPVRRGARRRGGQPKVQPPPSSVLAWRQST